MSSSSAASLPSAMAAHPSRPGSYPAEILLDENCRIGSSENSTSATTENSEGLSVEVSFEIRDPPALSLCFARCYDMTGRQRLPGEPWILAVAGGLVLLAIPFCDGNNINRSTSYVDYFVYRAGPGTPSLHHLPGPYPTSYPMKAAILPICDDDGSEHEHYAVVFPVVDFIALESRHRYTLHIYRSDRKEWRTQAGSISGGDWGVLLCNVLDEEPTMRFLAVPVPEPWATHTEFVAEFEDRNPRPYRQMTVHDGVVKFTELKLHRGPAFNAKRRDDQGWMATTWTRPISSDVWQEGSTFDTSDISVAGSSSSLHLLLPEILDGEKKLTWEKAMSGAPTLSLHDDDVVYIMVRMGLCDPTASVLAVNTRSLTLESCAQCSAGKMLGLEPTYVPSVLSSYFSSV
ncbi:hypothetical protein ACQ4PT_010307 [Festuca glaucescens]